MKEKKIFFHPIISWIQKVNLYEEKNMFYLIGSNNSTTRFRVLKIDRTDSRELTVVDDGVEYSPTEIRRLVEKLESAHRSRHIQRVGASAKIFSAYGVAGFIKFTEGYYIILITKRQQVAMIGHHVVYKIKDTALVYIPQDVGRSHTPLEQRYIKIFQSIDLSSNFYFSYSYDLTRTLQGNMTPPSDFPLDAFAASPIVDGVSESPHLKQLQESLHFGVRSRPNDRFVWNWNLLKPVLKTIHPDWILYLIHGFVDQSNGDVANEVETEQMVQDACLSSFQHGHYSSFVQMRGSVPGHWSQDISTMVPKPQISFDLSDPYGETSGKHFNQLLCRYGSPIIILNLVKKRETKKQESVLSEQLNQSVRYLNQFLPPKHHIRYTSFDMARMSKTKDKNVMHRLANIARSCVQKTGIFVSKPLPGFGDDAEERVRGTGGQYQTGVVRVNCVDCLDRTNTAQFAVGRWALGAQLCALGVLREPSLEFDTDCIRILEALYEDHGDTLALQYGGSQLVHRIETYRKTAPWTSQGNDIMQTLSRYYSNTFSDADKQNAINLFLGLFEPSERGPHIWECIGDYYLHQSWAMGKIERRMTPLTQWWDQRIISVLPRSFEELSKTSMDLYALRPDDESVNSYADYHRPLEVTNLKDTFAFQVSHSVRDFMPNFTTDYSPFAVRVRPGRRREESGKPAGQNPSLSGQSSSSSLTSSEPSSSEASEDSLSDDDLEGQIESRGSRQEDTDSELAAIPYSELLPSMTDVYGLELQLPSKLNALMYRRYQTMYNNSKMSEALLADTPIQLQTNINRLPQDSEFETALPMVGDAAVTKYQEYVLRGWAGAAPPNHVDKFIYKAYVARCASTW